jgi:DNA-binding NarL/FixJ family response regulator
VWTWSESSPPRFCSGTIGGSGRCSSETEGVLSDTSRCLVIDGQPMVRVGVREVLGDRYEVEETNNGKEAVQLLTDVGSFDVAIVDMRPPQDSTLNALWGAATIRALLEAQPGLGVVAHGDRPERHLVNEAIAAGAKAFVAKSSPPQQLSRAVEAAADAETFIDPAAGGRRPRGSQTLTKRQREILQMFADGNSTIKVARRLGLSAETVKTHTKQMRSRLRAHDRAHAVAIGIRNSLID